MANIAAMGDAAQSVEQGISGAFTCVESCMKSVLEMKHLIENEANKDADENAMKEQFVSAAMAQLKELAGTNFNIIIVRDYEGDTKGFNEADPPMPLIKVEYSQGQTADYRIYLFTKGDYQRPEGPRWEESDIQWWPHDGTTVYKPGGVIVDEIMKLTFSQRPGMTRAEREAKQNSLTLDKAVRDANTRITAQDAEEIRNSDNPEQTKKDIEARNAAAKAGVTNGTTDTSKNEGQPDEDDADPDAENAPEEDTEEGSVNGDQNSQQDGVTDAENGEDEGEGEVQDGDDDDQKSDATFGQNQPDIADGAQENEDPSPNESVDDQIPDPSKDTTEQENDPTTADSDEASQPESDAVAEEPTQDQDSATPSPDVEAALDENVPEPEEPEPEDTVPEEDEQEEAEPKETEKPEDKDADAKSEGEDEDGE